MSVARVARTTWLGSTPRSGTVVHFGFRGRFAGAGMPASSAPTRTLLGWEPRETGFLADLDEGHCFQA